MKRLILPQLAAALALPIAVKATNYVECEAIQKVANISAEILSKNYPSLMQNFINKEQKIYDQAMRMKKK